MLKLTWKILSSPDIVSALNKLYNCDKMPFPETYTAGRLAGACKSQLQKAHDKNMEILNKWAKKDEKGKLLPPKMVGNQAEYEFEDDKQGLYENEVKQLAINEFEVKGHKIHVSKLPNGLLTGAEAIALVDVLDGVEDLD